MLVNYRIIFLALLWLAAPFVHPQATSKEPSAAATPPAPTRDDLVAATRGFFRDSVEFPLRQQLTISISKGSGPLKTINDASLDYVFHGYRTGKKTPAGEVDDISLGKWLHAWDAFKGALHGDVVMLVPVDLILNSKPSTLLSFELTSLEDNSHGWTLRISAQHECPAFAMTRSRRWNIPDVFCGIADFRLRDDLSIESFTFYSGGLPARVNVDHLGKRSLLAYSVEVHFREVLLQESADPFVIPRTVTTTLETDKGKLVVQSDYEPEREIAGERFTRASR